MTTFVPTNQTIGEFDTKQALLFLQGELDLELLRAYCMEHGERRVMERGEMLKEAGKPAQWVAYVERSRFKYMVHNNEENKDYCIMDYFLPRGISMKYSNP